jgi:hypothetical protein
MTIHRTALGKLVDMSILTGKHENTRAVSNVRGLNARGDTIDSNNNVIKPVASKVNEMYAKTIGNKSAQPRAQQPTAQTKPEPAPIEIPDISAPVELTAAELELEQELDQEPDIEEIKTAEIKTSKRKKT